VPENHRDEHHVPVRSLRRSRGAALKNRAGFLRESAAIVAFAVVAAAISNAFAGRERRLAWFGRPPAAAPPARTASMPAPAPGTAPTTEFPPHPDRPFVEITPDQAKALYDRGAFFVDARRTAAYREGHVRGAQSIPVWESDADERVKALLDSGRDTNAPIVVYCSGGDCEDSHELAQKLWGITFDAVYVYRDGFPDWQKRGWPVAAGGER
jgi:rhodanese-related sulfurtransferase